MAILLDHLVVAAESLEQGVEFIQGALGVAIPYGGEHPQMATHNHLMATGKSTFLEVIAINPNWPAPKFPRWFALDNPYIRQQLKHEPQLLTWVVNSPSLEKILKSSKFPLGQAHLISRSNLQWYFALPEDGRLLASGIIPYLIQWRSARHPAENMPDLGCRFISLDIFHPQINWLEGILNSIGADQIPVLHLLPENELPYFTATFDTPNGIKTLNSFKSK